MKSTPHIEIVLPVYNEVSNIQPLVRQLDQTAAMLKGFARVTYLFVNDGSQDGSRELLSRLHKERDDIRVVELIHNFGHSPALSAGIEHFDADIAVFMDADLQDAPVALVEMFRAWQKGAKTVVAERGKRAERSGILFHAFYFLLHKSNRSLPPINFGTYCLLDRTVVARMKSLTERNRYFPELVSFASQEITSVKLDRNPRNSGASRVGVFGLINLALTAFTSSSSVPVKMVSLLGIMCSGAACLGGFTFVCIKLFTEKAIPGWASMMTAIAFGSGIQLLCLGIIGEYVARIYDEVKNRPLYMVDKVLTKPRKSEDQDVA